MASSTYTLSLWQRCCYKVLFALVYVLSLLPLRALYLLSESFYLLVYYVAGYRRKLVRKHLSVSFPERGDHKALLYQQGGDAQAHGVQGH